ncbi:MAG: S-layer family protein [Leptolyngbyaceae cyanobacterium RU_5_1]|nr:S-layer family protein [Leptolyngbyaceae cyanobacterium RU_5_1]
MKASGRQFWLVGMAFSSLAIFSPVQAQIDPDTTLPINSLPSPATPTCPGTCISGGTRSGVNLFHSFSAFSVVDGATVTFFDPGVANIISRVTGNTQTEILGRLGTSTGSTANLFLLNPNGIIFGRNARLSIGGSFVATTASAIEFENKGFFSTVDINSNLPLLTVNPSALLINQIANPIINRSQVRPSPGLPAVGLEVLPGKSLLLVGGDVKLDGGIITTSGGRIELAGVKDQGRVKLNVSDSNLSLGSVEGTTLADISLSNNAEINVSRSGNAGVVVIRGDTVALDSSRILNGTFNKGKGDGQIVIQANKDVILNQSQIQSITRDGGGNAAQITITANSGIRLQNSEITSVGSTTPNPTTGNSGNIAIDTGFLFLSNNSVVGVEARSGGDAGRISIRATGDVSMINSRILSFSGEKAPGVTDNAGDIDIHVDGVFVLADSSRINAQTFGKASAGNVTIRGRQLTLQNGSLILASTEGEGRGGNIRVFASESVSLSGVSSTTGRSSGLFTTSEATANNRGGEIEVTTNTLQIAEGAVLSARTRSDFRGGDINVNVNTLELTGGGQILTTTFNGGSAGNIKISGIDSMNLAERVVLTGSDPTFAARSQQFGDNVDNDGPTSGLFARTQGAGAAGNVTVTTRQLIVKDGAQISAATRNQGAGGSINITANSFEATNGGQLRTTTFGSGRAGNITTNITDSLTLTGTGTGLFANTEQGSTGQGGSIVIDPRTVTVRDGASIAVDSEGSGTGGNIEIQAGRITLDTRGLISAAANSSQGGNITLNVQDLLFLRRGSTISATAGRTQGEGDGGNIRIFAPNGFIVAAPNENSDITANAFTGSGGRVIINAQKIFWLVPRSRADLERLLGGSPLDPRRLPTNDITAISQENPNLSGEVTINTPDVDPNRGLVPLPINLVDPSGLIAQECSPTGKQASSSFVVTGQGGLPPNPAGVLGGEAVITRLATLKDRQAEQSTTVKPASTAVQPVSEIVEAQGWVVGPDGVVTLVAEAPNAAPGASWAVPLDCQRE